MRKPIGLSLEDNMETTVTGTDTVMLSDTLLELNGVNDDHAQIQSDFEQLDEAESLTKTVEDITTVLEKSDTVPADAIAINNIAVEALVTRLGLENNLPATTNSLNGEFTVKENKETTKTAWEKIKAFIMNIIKKIGEFFKKIYSFIKDIVAKIKHTFGKFKYLASQGHEPFIINNEKAERVFGGKTENIPLYLANIVTECRAITNNSNIFLEYGVKNKTKTTEEKATGFIEGVGRVYKKEDPKKYHVTGEGDFYVTNHELLFGKPLGFFLNDTGIHFVLLEEKTEYKGMKSIDFNQYDKLLDGITRIEETVKHNSKLVNAKLQDLIHDISKADDKYAADKGVLTLITKSYSTLNMTMLKTAATLTASTASYLQTYLHELSSMPGVSRKKIDEISTSLKTVYDKNADLATA